MRDIRSQQLLVLAEMFGVELPDRRRMRMPEVKEIQPEESKQFYLDKAKAKRERKALRFIARTEGDV
jgi:hypothetical protein